MCEHKTVCFFDARIPYSDVVLIYDGKGIDNPMDQMMSSEIDDPEGEEFPEEIEDLGIQNRSSGSYVEVNMKICVDCRTIL